MVIGHCGAIVFCSCRSANCVIERESTEYRICDQGKEKDPVKPVVPGEERDYGTSHNRQLRSRVMKAQAAVIVHTLDQSVGNIC